MGEVPDMINFQRELNIQISVKVTIRSSLVDKVGYRE